MNHEELLAQNEQLRAENAALKLRLTKLEQEATTLEAALKESSFTLRERIYRRIAPQSFRRWRRLKRIEATLEYWGGSNLSPNHPLFWESMFKLRSGLEDEFDVRLNNYPDIPFLVRAGTADPNPFRQVVLERQYLDVLELAPLTEFILDLGANVGYSTLWFAIQYPHASICAVEPLPSNYARLRRQIEAAGLSDRVTALEVAVDAKPGTSDFYQLQEGFFHTSGSLLPERERFAVCRVECVTMAQILDQARFPHVDIIKMDVEGAEERIFQDINANSQRLVEAASVVALETHGPIADHVVGNFFLGELGWNCKVHGEIKSFYKSRP